MTRLTVYEHERLGQAPEGRLTAGQLTALQRFHASSPQRYFDLCYRGIQLLSYVGVLRVGDLQLEILPKLDRHHAEPFWRDRLLDMLRVVHRLPLAAPTSTQLQTRPHNILDLYLERYAHEVSKLLRRGLARRYRTTEQNATALRGRLLFAEQLRHNLVHRERFYTATATYDQEFVHHQILLQGLKLAVQLTDNPLVSNTLRASIARFPELPALRITPAVFDRLPATRATRSYGPALSIARLLLLNYHPDLVGGREHLMALLFDMNALWERFLTVALQRYLPDYEVAAQPRKAYWQSDRHTATLQPDIVLRRHKQIIVLDAKWKELSGGQPGAQDLRQLYAYALQFGAEKAALLLPGARPRVRGEFGEGHADSMIGREGSVLYVPLGGVGEAWLRDIAARIYAWIAGK
ncbi:hypothetical protein LEM8419_01007 [Neolewinella maritima]|uniref:Restriction endonuclease n=1 Tax=Neolewinella maritima TaxID=1383882 RepID=A0ABN8F0B4_9BACT|nr:McrC family protein [Neolewinella maritima]CAH0999707.1 hypothetical protein LEM8419_01007 [Neolewinella maritima]